MVDQYIDLGGAYFDTAYTYLNGLSEQAITALNNSHSAISSVSLK